MYRRAHSSARVDSLTSTAIVVLLIFFTVSFPVFYLLGQHAPQQYKQVEFFDRNNNPSDNATKPWSEPLRNIDKMNLGWQFVIQLGNKLPSEGISRTLHLDITLEAQNEGQAAWSLISNTKGQKYDVLCPQGKSECVPLVAVHVLSIDYNVYKPTVVIRGLGKKDDPLNGPIKYSFRYVNAHFSLMALVLQYFLIAVNAMVLWRFYTTVKEEDAWDTHYSLLLLLVVTLILFNDPLIVGHLVVGGFAFELLSVLFKWLFFGVLVLFVVHYLDRVFLQLKELNSSFAEDSPPSLTAKILVVGSLFACCAICTTIIQLHQWHTPSYRPSVDFSLYGLAHTIVLLLVVVVVLWIGYLLLRNLGEVRDISYQVSAVQSDDSDEFVHLKRRLLFFTAATSFVFIAFAVPLGLWFSGKQASPFDTNTSQYLAYTVLVNIYVCMIALLEVPWPWNPVHGSDDGL